MGLRGVGVGGGIYCAQDCSFFSRKKQILEPVAGCLQRSRLLLRLSENAAHITSWAHALGESMPTGGRGRAPG